MPKPRQCHEWGQSESIMHVGSQNARSDYARCLDVCRNPRGVGCSAGVGAASIRRPHLSGSNRAPAGRTRQERNRPLALRGGVFGRLRNAGECRPKQRPDGSAFDAASGAGHNRVRHEFSVGQRAWLRAGDLGRDSPGECRRRPGVPCTATGSLTCTARSTERPNSTAAAPRCCRSMAPAAGSMRLIWSTRLPASDARPFPRAPVSHRPRRPAHRLSPRRDSSHRGRGASPRADRADGRGPLRERGRVARCPSGRSGPRT